MPYRIVLVAAFALVPLSAVAQGGGYAGSAVGLPASGVPSNPFASNYPSAPPPGAVRDRRERRVVRRPPRDPALRPPGRIPR